MLLFNLLKVTSDVAAHRLDPRIKIKGKFLAEKLRNNDNVIYLEDPNLKNSSINCAHVLRDGDDNVVTVFLLPYGKLLTKCPLKHVRSC